ncbi:MAG TPA: metallophosphoesterase [Bryobacteraceae bacterium]|nr:metallophosphoesterase [Bryobacteraceae bacterium]
MRTPFAFWCATSLVLAAEGPLIQVADKDLAASPVMVIYGDTRFTNPAEETATNPKVRRWLVAEIAKEKPDLIVVSGDLPWNGGEANDYVVYHEETAAWRALNLRVAPALGNHEFHGTEQQCLENWWHEFPALRGKRWYSVALGSRVFVLNLDSMSSLLPGSDERNWIEDEFQNLPASVQYVFLNLHHPPVADVQAVPDTDHNPRDNEIGLTAFLEQRKMAKPVRFIVSAGHIHNYERFLQNGVTYLVEGGGGAKPRPVVRGPADLYQDKAFPNYGYVRLTLGKTGLKGEMIRVADPAAAAPRFETKDHFEIPAP